jgi:hypothetical protein
MEERLFGRALLRTNADEVFSLDLYETSGLVCRGAYLPSRRRLWTWRVPPATVELVADGEARATVEVLHRMYRRGTEDEFEVSYEGGELYGQIGPPIESPGRLQWSGRLRGELERGGGSFDFLLEQFGSWEVSLLIMLLFYLLFQDPRMDAAWERCKQQAIEQCGEGNIKVSNFNKGMTGATLSGNFGCQIECFERTGSS